MDFKAEHTVSKILKYLFIAMALGLILLWFIGGGAGKIVEKARSFTSISSIGDLTGLSFEGFRLPWQIEMPTVSVSPISDNGSLGSSPTYGVVDDDRPNFDNPSPYFGLVEIRQAAAMTQSPNGQYIELLATGNTNISISGWSLESAASGARATIPEAAALFRMGSVNAVAPVKLAPGGRVLVLTGPSPVGVSFQENKCTGYLGTLQPFVPELVASCPAPLSAIPRTSASEARLGSSCFDYLSTLSPCTFPANPPSTLSAACRAEIQNTLSYNGCVNQQKNTPGFSSHTWRVYLAWGKPLWNVGNDIIRLLDDRGRIVNVLNY